MAANDNRGLCEQGLRNCLPDLPIGPEVREYREGRSRFDRCCPEPAELSDLKAVYAGGHAREITDANERAKAWKQLMERHSNLAGFQIPDASEGVFMRMTCKYVSVLDFSQGIGHREQLTVDDAGVPVDVTPIKDEWGTSATTA